MEIKPRTPTATGPAAWFTGDVSIDSIVEPHDGSSLSVAAVHFRPGARTAWHSHDGGQHLHVTEGEGRVQTRDRPVVTIGVGDVVWTPSGEEHWHGAAPGQAMTHLSMTTGAPTWGDHVSDDEYGA